ncbi:GAP family protein [Micromonospora sp. WMMD736]|uniref:GAP family protein n=1 Tax=Micromonospora sp. WMMD736 TaxID=3404112 RepID=UPI003B92B4E5
MAALVLTLAGLAMLDSANVLNIGVVSAVVYDSRLGRRSPIPGGLSYIAGVFVVTTTFGLAVVLGLSFLTELLDFEITPTLRYRGELLLGLALIGLAYFPLTAQTSAPGFALTAMRQRPWLLGFVGLAVGMGQAPTAVPYLTGLAMLAALDPRPAYWPLIIYAYWTIALLPSLVVLGLSARRTKRAQRIQRWLVRTITRYGPISVRILFLGAGVVLVIDALIHYQALW